MCIDCWNEAGNPANWTLEIAEALGLVRELYAIHAVGGPYHVQLDDWNIDGGIVPAYEYYDDADLDRLYCGQWPLDELDPAAPVVVQGLGRSMRQICDEIAAKMGPMTVEDRMSVLAYHDGFATPAIEEQR
jgi:hypothetical protein